MAKLLPKPTVELVTLLGAAFDADKPTKLADDALTLLFTTYPNNSDVKSVTLKVLSLNAIYATNLALSSSNLKRITAMATHIVDLEIDSRLTNGELGIVDLIASADLGGMKRRYYSFASKYCSWQRPSSFPIYDSRARGLLIRYKRQDRFHDFTTGSVWCENGYRKYVEIIDAFRAHYQLDSLDYKQIDKFLYWFDYWFVPGAKEAESQLPL